MRKSDREPWIVRTLGQVARFFAVHPDTIKAWRRVGMPGSAGGWDLAAIVAWRDGRQKTEQAVESPHAQLAKIKAERERFELERDRGGWVELDPVCRLIIRTVNEAKVRLDQLPDQVLATLPTDLPAARQAAARRRIERVIDDVYRGLAEISESQELAGQAGEE